MGIPSSNYHLYAISVRKLLSLASAWRTYNPRRVFSLTGHKYSPTPASFCTLLQGIEEYDYVKAHDRDAFREINAVRRTLRGLRRWESPLLFVRWREVGLVEDRKVKGGRFIGMVVLEKEDEALPLYEEVETRAYEEERERRRSYEYEGEDKDDGRPEDTQKKRQSKAHGSPSDERDHRRQSCSQDSAPEERPRRQSFSTEYTPDGPRSHRHSYSHDTASERERPHKQSCTRGSAPASEERRPHRQSSSHPSTSTYEDPHPRRQSVSGTLPPVYSTVREYSPPQYPTASPPTTSRRQSRSYHASIPSRPAPTGSVGSPSPPQRAAMPFRPNSVHETSRPTTSRPSSVFEMGNLSPRSPPERRSSTSSTMRQGGKRVRFASPVEEAPRASQSARDHTSSNEPHAPAPRVELRSPRVSSASAPTAPNMPPRRAASDAGRSNRSEQTTYQAYQSPRVSPAPQPAPHPAPPNPPPHRAASDAGRSEKSEKTTYQAYRPPSVSAYRGDSEDGGCCDFHRDSSRSLASDFTGSGHREHQRDEAQKHGYETERRRDERTEEDREGDREMRGVGRERERRGYGFTSWTAPLGNYRDV